MPVSRARATLLRRGERGQVAMAFIALLGLIVLLTPPLMNLGEVARLKTKTAIAADAGAISGASYGASASNHGARRAQVMQWIFWIVQTIYFVPFCVQALPMAIELWVAADMAISSIQQFANSYMAMVFFAGRAATLRNTLANIDFEDRTGFVATNIETLFAALDQGPNARPLDPPATLGPPELSWTREALIDEPSWAQVDYVYPPDAEVPQVSLGGFRLTFWWWLPGCWLFLCLPIGWGWQANFNLNLMANMAPFMAMSHSVANAMTFSGQGGLWWVQVITPIWVGVATQFNFPGPCGYPVLLPIFVPTNVRRPNNITWATNRVRVTVQRHREPGAQMAWWTMQYPDVSSMAVAEYTGAHVRMNPFRAGDRAIVELRCNESNPC